MSTTAAARHLWTLELLDVQPDDRLLEIGCGAGIVASIVAERIDNGRIVAIDRSESMIKMASKRSETHVMEGRATFETVDLSDFDPGERTFNKIYAVNVSLFWKEPSRELSLLRSILSPGAKLHIIHHPPSREKAASSARIMVERLEASGYAVRDVMYRDLDGIPAVCVVSEPLTTE